MFRNTKGPNEAVIDDVVIVGIHDDRRGKIVMSQSSGRIIFTAQTETGLTRGRFSFSKRDLSELVEQFENEKDFGFEPRSGSGELKFSRPRKSLDFGMTFPDGLYVIPQVEDFREALAKMQGEPTDLYAAYPEIAKLVDKQAAASDKHVWVFAFKVNSRNSATREILRYRGNPLYSQIMALRRLTNVPRDQENQARGHTPWTEHSKPGSKLNFELLDQHIYDYGISLDLPRMIVDGFSQAHHYYLNGQEISKSRFDFGRDEKCKIGDVLVAVTDFGSREEPNLRFHEMPEVSVYRRKLDGPYVHPAMNGMTCLDLFFSGSDALDSALDLDMSDEVICPRCGKADCDSHNLRPGDHVYIRRYSGEDEFLFAFQAPTLVGNATDALAPFSEAIIGRKLETLDWPDEVVSISINGRDVEGILCTKTIRKSDSIKVVIC